MDWVADLQMDVGSGKRKRNRSIESETPSKTEKQREREREWLGFRISAFYNRVLGRRFYKNRRPVFSKSSAKIILGDELLKSSPKYSILGDDFLYYKSRRPR